MDQFVSTYRKDFLWPYVRSFGMKPDAGPRFGLANACRCTSGSTQPKLIGPNVYSQQSFQKQGPTTPLQEPRIYMTKVGPTPENDTQRFNQPNVFLERLKAKYPFLYEVLRSASPDDLISRIHRERLRTTYQTDYCHLQEYPSAPYDQLIRGANFQGKGPCADPVRLPGDSFRPKDKPPQGSRTQGRSFGRNDKRCGGFGNAANVPGGNIISVGTTEYQDAISKLGEHIIRDRIHYKGLKLPHVY